MYKDKKRCKKCMYGWLPNGHPTKLVEQPMCLFFHDTGMHRDGDDDTCNSFKELTQEEINKRQSENRRRYENARSKLYY